jgi:hypothetical protein
MKKYQYIKISKYLDKEHHVSKFMCKVKYMLI